MDFIYDGFTISKLLWKVLINYGTATASLCLFSQSFFSFLCFLVWTNALPKSPVFCWIHINKTKDTLKQEVNELADWDTTNWACKGVKKYVQLLFRDETRS